MCTAYTNACVCECKCVCVHILCVYECMCRYECMCVCMCVYVVRLINRKHNLICTSCTSHNQRLCYMLYTQVSHSFLLALSLSSYIPTHLSLAFSLHLIFSFSPRLSLSLSLSFTLFVYLLFVPGMISFRFPPAASC